MYTSRELFFGRASLIHTIQRGVLATQPASFGLVGPRFSGKSALLRWLAGEGALCGAEPDRELRLSPTILLVDCSWVTTTTFFDQIWDLVATRDWVESQPENSGDSFQRLVQLAQQQLPHRRLVLLLDNFDAFWQDSVAFFTLQGALQRLMPLLTLVMATAQPFADLDAITPDSTPFGAVPQLFVGLLEWSAAQQWLAHYQQQYPGLEVLGDELLTLTGRHPYLLRKLGDSLVEVQQMLGPGQRFASHHLLLIRLRLAEHARPLFVSLWQRLEAQSGTLQLALYTLLDRLTRSPLPLEQVPREQTPALNWLINQATILYTEAEGQAVYQLFSPLLADFVIQRRLAVPSSQLLTPVLSLPTNHEHFYEQLSKMEVALLRYFEKHSQRLVTMEQLLAEVWKQPTSSTRRVQEAIRRLRLQLEQQTPPIGIIENERGRGYRFIPAQGQG